MDISDKQVRNEAAHGADRQMRSRVTKAAGRTDQTGRITKKSVYIIHFWSCTVRVYKLVLRPE